MKMAQINLPTADNDGRPLWKEQVRLTNLLLDHFGGYTVSRGIGAWKDENGHVYQEDVYIFQVAMDDTAINAETLRQIARQIGEQAGQKAMFLALPSGNVEIMDV